MAALAACAAGGLCATSEAVAVTDAHELQPQSELEPEPECLGEGGLPDEPDAADELASAVTIMVNTSPIEIHPSTIVIEEIVGALLGHVPLLRKCPILIVCDWFKVKEQNKYRAGQITAEKAARYEEYVARLRRLAARGSGNVLEGARVLVLSERCGFGFAVKEALPHVVTPYPLLTIRLAQMHTMRLEIFDQHSP
jgi:hypothetical protein